MPNKGDVAFFDSKYRIYDGEDWHQLSEDVFLKFDIQDVSFEFGKDRYGLYLISSFKEKKVYRDIQDILTYLRKYLKEEFILNYIEKNLFEKM